MGAREARWEKGEKEGAMRTRRLGDTWRGGAFTVRHRKTEREREHTGREPRGGGRREEPSRGQTGTWERQWEAGESRERKYREKGRGEGRVRKRQDRQQERESSKTWESVREKRRESQRRKCGRGQNGAVASGESGRQEEGRNEEVEERGGAGAFPTYPSSEALRGVPLTP